MMAKHDLTEEKLHSVVVQLNQRAAARGFFDLPADAMSDQAESIITEICYDANVCLVRRSGRAYALEGLDTGLIRLCTDRANPDFGFSYSLEPVTCDV